MIALLAKLTTVATKYRLRSPRGKNGDSRDAVSEWLKKQWSSEKRADNTYVLSC